MFFEKLNKLHVSDECLKAIPELFVPSCGKYYADSLVKIAIMGKETYEWGDSLYENLKDFEKGKSIISNSETRFRTEGPSKWRNPFWQYFAEVLALMYDVDVNSVLEKDSPIINSIALKKIPPSSIVSHGIIAMLLKLTIQEVSIEVK